VDRSVQRFVTHISSICPNITFLGERHFSDIPSYISRFDVLINFKRTDFMTIGNDSMKIYEYLATGKPIVSTPVPPADRFTDLLYVASDKYEFAHHLTLALQEEDSKLREQRIKMARENSWAKRVDVILDEVMVLI
jgi:glycosyltransferase involved in cell wall biosynthesis